MGAAEGETIADGGDQSRGDERVSSAGNLGGELDKTTRRYASVDALIVSGPLAQFGVLHCYATVNCPVELLSPSDSLLNIFSTELLLSP